MKKFLLILTMMFLGILSVYACSYCNHYCKPIIINNTGMELDGVYIHTRSKNVNRGNSIKIDKLEAGEVYDSSARNDGVSEQGIIGCEYSYKHDSCGEDYPKSNDLWSFEFSDKDGCYARDSYNPRVDNYRPNQIACWGGEDNMAKPLVCDGVISFNKDEGNNIYVSISINGAPAMKYNIYPA